MWGKSFLRRCTEKQPIYSAENVIWWPWWDYCGQGYHLHEFLMTHRCSECPSDSQFGNCVMLLLRETQSRGSELVQSVVLGAIRSNSVSNTKRPTVDWERCVPITELPLAVMGICGTICDRGLRGCLGLEASHLDGNGRAISASMA